MHYAPGQEPCPLSFSPFKSCTVPRPIGWLSTISVDGVLNLAPYSQWQNLSFDPPLVIFAVTFFNPAFIHKDNAVGNFAGKTHLMGYNHHCHPITGEFAHHIQNLINHLWIKRGCGFIKQHHPWFHRQCSCDGNALLLAA